MKIAVNAISKNEVQFVERFCTSAKEADLIIIADTGSTDGTVAKARACGAVVHDICITPWRFDMARNAALALVPRDVDVVVSLDLDEVLEPGWRQEVERLWVPGVTRMRYKFDWSAGVVFYSEKIFARHGYHWHHPCHEYIRPDARLTEIYAHTDRLLVSHHPDPSKSRGQYLELLELSVKEDPHCPRNAFYYARELIFNRRWVDAVVALNKYLELPKASWNHERCYAMRLLGKAYEALGEPARAKEWLVRATQEAPKTREPWVDLAGFAQRTSQWRLCYDSALAALSVEEKALVYTMDPEAWGAKPHDLLALAAYNLGKTDKALEHGQIACEMAPQDVRMARNLTFYAQRKAE